MHFLLKHTLLRRFFSISLVGLVSLLLLVSLPVWLPLSLLVGLLVSGWQSATRCLCFITVFAVCECLGVLAAGAIWLQRPFLSHDEYLAANRRLQTWWASTLKGAAERLFRLHFEADEMAALDGPAAIVLPRHTSIGDTVLPLVFYAAQRNFAVRYVLKRELLLDPCLDIVGNRLPNVFLDRASDEMTLELDALQSLANSAGERDALIIYMEGTRFSSRKLDRIVSRLESSDSELAAGWETVLPPRMGGALALIEGAPEKDLLFFAHTGFEGAGSFAALFNGSWLDGRVRLCFWRIKAADIPRDIQARRAMLLAQWRHMDKVVQGLAAGLSVGDGLWPAEVKTLQ